MAVVSAVVGVFTVLRGQSFAGHSLADVATAGGSGAFLVGINPLFGFVAGRVIGAGAMEMIGVRRARGRDLATGIVLGASIGLAALFLYLSTTVVDDRRQPADPVRVDLLHRQLHAADRGRLQRPVLSGSWPSSTGPSSEFGRAPIWPLRGACLSASSDCSTCLPWRWQLACRRWPSARSFRRRC